MADQDDDVRRPLRFAEPHFAAGEHHRLGEEAEGRQRDARHRELVRCGNQHEVALGERDRLVSGRRKAARSFEDDAVERLAGIGAAQPPSTRAANHLGQRGGRLQQGDDLGQGIDHSDFRQSEPDDGR